MNLIALNLPRNFTEDALAKLFKKYGNIKACNLVMDAKTGASKGFGFVEMALEHEAMVAIKELNGSIIDKKKIRVKASE
ncbi:MAG: RNA-binding protein [Rickettsiales bacterium]|jgi:RNA recognition motif-containing protein